LTIVNGAVGPLGGQLRVRDEGPAIVPSKVRTPV
jgi:hypothetical protein